MPEARVVVAHGQMPEELLERTVEGFWNREYDILVCTTIVETGLDISNANTLIVERADTFGLSQLHQLRGRVGRSRERGYAYFLYPPEVPLTETAYDRLATIAQNNELGAGMAVAMKDLEIRGAGNVLGVEQSGPRRRRGIRPVRAAGGRGGRGVPRRGRRENRCAPLRNRRTCGSTCRSTRTCRRTTSAATGCGWRPTAGWRRPPTTRAVDAVIEELVDRYGPLPEPAQRLVAVARLRLLCREYGVTEVSAPSESTLRVSPLTLLDSQQLRLKRMYPSATLPGDDVDGAGADSPVGRRRRRAADPRSRTGADGGRSAVGARWKTAGRC